MDFETVADGLRFPEGPVWMLDGSVIVVEIESGKVTRILPDGRKETVATPGGGPNGAAIGPDGALYVCNNGGMACFEENGLIMTDGQAASTYETGRIERIDLATGKVERLYDRLGDRPLWGPNDIVFDTDGGMWFSDFGKHLNHAKNDGGIFYARPDGSFITRAVDKLNVNGIGLSPDGKKVYAALTDERLILEFDVTGPGELSPTAPAGRVVTSFPNRELLDSFAVTEDGHICVGTLFEKQGITSIDPATGQQTFYPFPDFFTTNICFGGADMRDAWITLSTTGKLVKVRWPKPGHRLAYYA